VMKYKVKGSTSSAAPTGRTYLLVKDGRGYVVSFGCFESDPADCLQQTDEMIQTFRIGS
jgi:hypothetical protein